MTLQVRCSFPNIISRILSGRVDSLVAFVEAYLQRQPKVHICLFTYRISWYKFISLPHITWLPLSCAVVVTDGCALDITSPATLTSHFWSDTSTDGLCLGVGVGTLNATLLTHSAKSIDHLWRCIAALNVVGLQQVSQLASSTCSSTTSYSPYPALLHHHPDPT